MKIYTVVLGISGSDFESDDPVILGVFDNKKDAKKCMVKAIKEYSTDENNDGGYLDEESQDCYEETGFDEDYHFTIKIVEKELKYKKLTKVN